MLDLASIMFSSVMLLLILLRALKQDKREPWFRPVKRDAPDRELKSGRTRRT